MRVLCFVLLAHAAAAAQFSISPSTVLMDDRVAIRVSGLSPNAPVTVRASSRDQRGCLWRSAATFRTRPDGTLDLTAQAPLSGSYSGVDAMGLFWSMRPDCKAHFFDAPDPFQPIVTDVEAADAHARVVRRYAGEGVRREILRRDGIVANLYHPPAGARHPAVLLLGGSEGGFPEPEGPMLASRGFKTLALAYFGVDGLPPAMQNIPLEYFAMALRALGDRVVVIGGSRGSEAALMLGATDARVAGVVASSPSIVRWEGSTAKMMPGGAAWTLEGRPLPYIPFHIGPGFAAKFLWSKLSGGGLSLLPMFLDSYRRSMHDDVVIPIEKTRAPILFASGADDRKWPSAAMAAAGFERLRRLRHPYDDRHLSFDGAGHWLPVSYVPTAGLKGAIAEEIGGAPEAEARAQAQWWPQLLAFLRARAAAD